MSHDNGTRCWGDGGIVADMVFDLHAEAFAEVERTPGEPGGAVE